jgi:hypothetical protein
LEDGILVSVGQNAAIALDGSEQIELRAKPQKKRRGRPKGVLSGAAKKIDNQNEITSSSEQSFCAAAK